MPCLFVSLDLTFVSVKHTNKRSSIQGLRSARKIKAVCQGYCINQWKLVYSFPFVTTGNFYQRQFGSVPIIIKIPSIFLATEEH